MSLLVSFSEGGHVQIYSNFSPVTIVLESSAEIDSLLAVLDVAKNTIQYGEDKEHKTLINALCDFLSPFQGKP